MLIATSTTIISLASVLYTPHRRSLGCLSVTRASSGGFSPEVSPLLRAAHHTVDNYVKSGMIIGLGCGEASEMAIHYLGHQLRSGSLQDIVGVPMSPRSASEAAKSGIPLKYFRDEYQIDFAFHDADVVEENTLIAIIGRKRRSQEDDYILQQKCIVKAADEVVFMIRKEQYKSGLEGSIPVLVPLVWRRSNVEEASPLGGDFPIVTSDGHNILDVIFTTPIPSLGKVATSLDSIDGIVDYGLVIKNRCTVVIAAETEVRSVTLKASVAESGI